MASSLTPEAYAVFQLLQAWLHDSIQREFVGQSPAAPWQGEYDFAIDMPSTERSMEVPIGNIVSTPSASISTRGARSRAFLDHRFDKTVDGLHVCKICTGVVKRRRDAKRHWMSKHGGQNPRCPKCGRRCSRKDALANHMRKCLDL